MKDYEVKIVNSSKPLTAREKIAFKDLSRAISFDASIKDDADPGISFAPSGWVELAIHNENSKDSKDYKNYIYIGKGGETYTSGSSTLFESFLDIFDTMAADAPEEEYTVTVYKRPSSNYKGKFMLRCSID